MSTGPTLFFSSVVTAAVVLVAAAQGCSLLTKTDRTKIEGSTGATGGTGGDTGGATGGATGGGGSGGTSSGGTGGSACTEECCAPTDCPEIGNECVARTCEANKCGTKPVSDGIPVSTQIKGDCQLVVCDGKGGSKSNPFDTDIPDDDKECTIDKCMNGTPANVSAPAGQSCNESGGKKCDGSGACLECLSPADCTSKVCTIAGACAPASCGDGVKNNDETDTDCGGSCGATCTTGKACTSEADCIDKVCSGTPKKCAAPTCKDKLKNGDETDVDCGGACGATCGPNKGCAMDKDCKGNACSGSVCLESCSDGVLNNFETALDCGGPVCTETCANGTMCAVTSDCTSGFCVDGVCCDKACNGACSACTAAKKGTGMDGTCGFASQGTDPHNDCDPAASTTCGNSTGECDGAGVCEKHLMGTPCGDLAGCMNGTQTNADSCDGTGTCVNAGTAQCGLYACGAVKCNTTCAGDTDCASTAYCANMVCVPKKAVATACGGANECTSGFCADGFCCGAACNGLCVACSVANGGTANGTCSPIALGQDPANDCGANGKCDGAGLCKKNVGQPCLLSTECLGGSCADGFCCNTPCVGLCQACSNLKKGSGANGSCAFVATNTDPDDECPGVTSCSGGAGGCTLLALGTSCAINGECQSGFCIDGVCCNTSCQGFCQACSAAKTGGANGTCADVTVGTDPDTECPPGQTCAGNNSCL